MGCNMNNKSKDTLKAADYFKNISIEDLNEANDILNKLSSIKHGVYIEDISKLMNLDYKEIIESADYGYSMKYNDQIQLVFYGRPIHKFFIKIDEQSVGFYVEDNGIIEISRADKEAEKETADRV